MIHHRATPVSVILRALLTFALLAQAPRLSVAAAVNASLPAGSAASLLPPGLISAGDSTLHVRILSPASGARISDAIVGVQVEATGGPFVEILLYADGALVDHLNPEKNPGFVGTLVWKGAQPGKHHLKVMAVDWNKSTAEAETDIEVGASEPGSSTKTPSPPSAPASAFPSAPPSATPSGFYVRFLNIADGGTLSVQAGDGSLPSALIRLEAGSSTSQTILPYQILLDADEMCLGQALNREKELSFKTEFTWRPLRGNGKYLLVARAMAMDRHTEASARIIVNVAGFPSSRPTPLDTIIQVYQKKYGLAITAPAVARFNNSANPSESMWVSTAYIGPTFYEVDLWDSGRTFARTRSVKDPREWPVCRPAGRLKLLVVFLDYRNTNLNRNTALKALRSAAAKSNGFYSQYAAAHGWKAPILQLDVAGAYVSPPPSTGKLLTVAQVKSLTGFDPAQFDMLFEVDLDSARTYERPAGMETAGGLTFRGCDGSAAHNVNIWIELGSGPAPEATLYYTLLDHELAHAMGWQHEWPIGGGSTTTTREWKQGIQLWPTLLFGWTDTDGDGLPEILDPTPYGLKK
jgi:hypothetical protein